MLSSTGFSQIKVWHYRVHLRFYLIKIKNVSANFGSEKQFKVKKKVYSMAKEIDLSGEK